MQNHEKNTPVELLATRVDELIASMAELEASVYEVIEKIEHVVSDTIRDSHTITPSPAQMSYEAVAAESTEVASSDTTPPDNVVYVDEYIQRREAMAQQARDTAMQNAGPGRTFAEVLRDEQLKKEQQNAA